MAVRFGGGGIEEVSVLTLPGLCCHGQAGQDMKVWKMHLDTLADRHLGVLGLLAD